MENEIQIFNNEEFGEVRTMMINDEPWFVGRDVAEILEYSNTRDALMKHVDDEEKGVAKCDTLGGKQDLVIINESGLYSLVFSSKLPEAKKFKHWVTAEVLPSIRKMGAYITPNFNNPAEAARAWADAYEAQQREKAEKEALAAQIALDAPKVEAANQLLDSEGLVTNQDFAKTSKMQSKWLIARLVKDRYLFRRGKRLCATAYGVSSGFIKPVEQTLANLDNPVFTPKITAKGQVFFLNKYKPLYELFIEIGKIGKKIASLEKRKNKTTKVLEEIKEKRELKADLEATYYGA